MSTITVRDIPLDDASPAQRLRRTAAAVRVHFTWWGVHKTLTAQQKEEVGLTYAADARFLTAGKKLVDTRHETFRRLTSVRSRATNYWRGLTLPYTEPGIRLIQQSNVESLVHTMEGFREELTQAETDLNTVYDQIQADARRRLGRLYNAADYPTEIRNLFSVDWNFPSVEPPSYLMRRAPEVYEEERRRVAARFDAAVRLAEQAFATEFARHLSHLTARLANGEDGQRQVFRDSVISNLTEFFSRFRELNVLSNPELDALVEQAQQLVRGVQPQDLRDSAGLRRENSQERARLHSRRIACETGEGRGDPCVRRGQPDRVTSRGR